LNRSFVTLSVIIDIAVLMITIWSFHLQYRAPPAIYLKAPTLMYVFILVALRTLRFEPRYVLIAGGCGAAGWLALFLYAAAGSGDTAPTFTHSYIDYVTSYKILRGAEIDNILSILMVTAILALSLVRARKLLVNSVAEEAAATDLARFFAPEIAEQLRRTEINLTAGQGTRRDAAILSIDLRGFTKLSHDMPPTELFGLLHLPEHIVAERPQNRLHGLCRLLDGARYGIGASAVRATLGRPAQGSGRNHRACGRDHEGSSCR
jgi:adenylate cyclase